MTTKAAAVEDFDSKRWNSCLAWQSEFGGLVLMTSMIALDVTT